jgi:hypothetical protein
MATKTRTFRLKDVDGTVPGVAMLVSADLSKGQDARPMHATWVEASGDVTDPYHSLLALWESIKGDWPGHTYSIIQNHRSRYLMAQTRSRSMGFEQTPREYWEAYA